MRAGSSSDAHERSKSPLDRNQLLTGQVVLLIRQVLLLSLFSFHGHFPHPNGQ